MAENIPDVVMLDAWQLSQAIHQKRVSCREVMQAYVRQPGANTVAERPEQRLPFPFRRPDGLALRGVSVEIRQWEG
jgi:hypothetical protein